MDFKAHIVSNEVVNAGVVKTTESQYLVYVNSGLLRACYAYLMPPTRSFFERRAPQFNVDFDLFARTCLGACGLMVFWHEMAHALRGHLAYLEAAGMGNSGLSEVDVNLTECLSISPRILELDADIYGAAFLLAQLTVVMDANTKISGRTFASAYAVGLRGLFHVLNGTHVHDDAPGSSHPSPISRAYTAFTHALARLPEMRMHLAGQEEFMVVATQSLVDFERADLGLPVSAQVLQQFAEAELEEWRKQSDALTPYQLLSSKS